MLFLFNPLDCMKYLTCIPLFSIGKYLLFKSRNSVGGGQRWWCRDERLGSPCWMLLVQIYACCWPWYAFVPNRVHVTDCRMRILSSLHTHSLLLHLLTSSLLLCFSLPFFSLVSPAFLNLVVPRMRDTSIRSVGRMGLRLTPMTTFIDSQLTGFYGRYCTDGAL